MSRQKNRTPDITDKAVTLAKMNDIATASLIYRKTAGTGAPEVNTLSTLKTDLGLSGTNSGDVTVLDSTSVDFSLTGQQISASVLAGGIALPKVDSPALYTVVDDFNVRGSSGVADGEIVYVTAAGANSYSVAAGVGYIRKTDDQQGELVWCRWDAVVGTVMATPAAGYETTKFIGIEYNAGTPRVIAKDTFTWSWYNEFPLARVCYDGTTLRILNAYAHAEDTADLTRRWFRLTHPFQREEPPEGSGGLVLGETAVRRLTMTAGNIWHGFNRYVLPSYNSTTQSFDAHWKKSGGGFNSTILTQWPNTQYDDGTGTLYTMTSSHYACLWVYADISNGLLDVMYGSNEYATSKAAEAEIMPTSIPDHLTYQGKLLGRIIFLKSAVTATLIQTVWTSTFVAGGITDHNQLTNLQGGITNEYYHLTSAQNSLLTTVTGPTILGKVSGTGVPAQLTPAQVRAIDGSADITLDMTGFSSPGSVVISYDSSTRMITLTGSWVAYWRGQVITALTSGWTSPTGHTNTTGHVYRLSFDGTNYNWTTDTEFVGSSLHIASVSFGASDKLAVRECHGLMPWSTHEYLHETVGTFRASGGALGAWVAGSTTVGNRRPTITATVIHDEDNISTNPTLTSSLYTQMMVPNGTSSTATSFIVDAAEIVPVLASRPYFNQYKSGTWSQVLMVKNTYMSVWLIAVPTTNDATSQKYRYLWVQGQSNTNLAGQTAFTPDKIVIGSLSTYVTEFVFIAQIIINYQSTNWVITSVKNLISNKAAQTTSPVGTYLTLSAGDLPAETGSTGVFMSQDSVVFPEGNFDIGGVNNGVVQFGISSTDGSAYAGAGAVVIDSNGITLDLPSGFNDINNIKWNATGTSVYPASIGAITTAVKTELNTNVTAYTPSKVANLKLTTSDDDSSTFAEIGISSNGNFGTGESSISAIADKTIGLYANTNSVIIDKTTGTDVTGALTVGSVPVIAVAPGTSGNVLTSTGAAWTSSSLPAGGGGGTVTLKNNTVSNLDIGTVVILDPSSASSFKTTTIQGDGRVMGVITGATINAGTTGSVAVGAIIATVKVNTNVAMGNALISSTTAGYAMANGGTRQDGLIGFAVTAYAGGATGTVQAIISPEFGRTSAAVVVEGTVGINASAAVGTLQCGTNPNRLVLLISTVAATAAITLTTAPKVGGSSMTQYGADMTTDYAQGTYVYNKTQIWYFQNPGTGNQTVTNVTRSSPSVGVKQSGLWIALSGVAASSFFGTTNEAIITGINQSVNTTDAIPGDLVVGVYFDAEGSGGLPISYTSSAGQTTGIAGAIYDSNIFGIVDVKTANAASTTIGWTIVGSRKSANISIPIRPA